MHIIFGDNKVSHAAAAFFLQKSNEVLSMIKAFKRKANNNASNGATTTSNDATKLSSTATATSTTTAASQSKRSTAVNCMQFSLNDDESVSFCDNFDASNCNIYTEIDLCNALPTKDLVTEPKTDTGSSESLSSDILCFLFNNSNDVLFQRDHNQSETSHINSYVNESVTSQACAQMEINVTNDACAQAIEQNLYDIGSDERKICEHLKSSRASGQLMGSAGTADTASMSDTSVKSNAFFTNISKSFKSKLKLMISEDDDLDESPDTANGTELPKDIVDKLSLKKRFKFKLKTGLNFFKDFKVRLTSIL